MAESPTTIGEPELFPRRRNHLNHDRGETMRCRTAQILITRQLREALAPRPALLVQDPDEPLVRLLAHSARTDFSSTGAPHF